MRFVLWILFAELRLREAGILRLVLHVDDFLLRRFSSCVKSELFNDKPVQMSKWLTF